MNLFRRFHRNTALFAGAMLLSASLAAHADDLQDAQKLFKQGQHSQALGKVNGYLAGKPKDAQARFLKGLILTEQNKVDEAISVFTALTQDFPELPEPYNNLAVLYASQNHYDKAKTALEMAIRTHPSYATAHENLGDIYAKMASQAYDRALQLDRSNTATQTKLAMIQDLFAGNSRSKTAAAPVKAAEKAAEPAKAAEPVKVAENKPEPAKSEPVAAKAAPAEKPAAANGSSDVLNAVHEWVTAWSAKDVGKYLASYAPDFKTPSGESRADWEAMRKDRISKPKSIQVKISKPTVVFADSNHATVKFKQSYRASNFKAFDKKTLEMVKVDGKWLIKAEYAK